METPERLYPDDEIERTDLPHYNLSADVRQFHAFHSIQRNVRNIVTPFLCIVGCIGNIINLLVLTKIRRRKLDSGKDSGAHLGLICLAVSDMCFCVMLFPRGFVPSTMSLFETMNIELVYQAYGTGLVTTFILTSTWLTVVMTFIRYVAICHPFSARQMNSYLFTKICYILVFVLCMVFNIPSYFQYHITDIDLDGHTHYLIDIGYFNDRTIHGKVFIWLKAILGIFVPAIVMAFCNLSLIVALRRSYKMRQECSHHSLRQNAAHSHRITLTLIAIVISFVILVYPSEIMDFFSEFIKMDTTKTETFLTMRSFANLFQVLNFACNFVLYCAINVHYRDALWELFTLNGRLTCKDIDKDNTRGRTRGQRFSLRTTTTQLQAQHGRGKNGHVGDIRPPWLADQGSAQPMIDCTV